ncbi:ABC transporter permease [Halobium palmae]|uniref:ABC transporter permease n=1 Tax=Halobium palmae TaxID=1776492 RepID=A0ABD5RXB2_9EURY
MASHPGGLDLDRIKDSSLIDGLRKSYLLRKIRSSGKLYLSDNLTVVFLLGFLFVGFLALFGQALAPYDPNRTFMDGGQIASLQPPSVAHPLGTTAVGTDILSRLMYGAQPTLLTGFAGGTVVISLGLLIGVSAGYYGGKIDDVLMRLTDFVYSVPLIPVALVFASYFGVGTWMIVFTVGFILWRGNARIFRSQVLQIKEREHVRAAKAVGASDWHIVTRHILPSMGGMVVLFYALGIGITILITASLAFLGFAEVGVPTWGLILRNAYDSGHMVQAWWWTFSSGGAITLTVLCIYMIGRGYERVHGTTVSASGD